MELIAHKRNNCVLVALRELTGKPDAEIFAAVRKHGYRDNRGMYVENYFAAAKDLGLKMTEEKRRWDLVPSGGDRGKMTLRDFVRAFPKGVFLVRTWGHALVVRDGAVVDPNWRRRAGLGRGIVGAAEIFNAHRSELKGHVVMVRPHIRRRTPGARERWAKVVDLLRREGDVTPERLLRETGFHKIDFEWDLKRGNLKMV